MTGPTRVIGKFEILEPLGRGAMGIVYKARDRELGRVVALKVLREGEDASPAVVMRFHREAELAGRLRHANIVSVHEAGEVADPGLSEPVRFIAMDYIEGPTLADQLPSFAGKTPAAVAVVETIARAIHFAHEKGIVHRDIKPANVLMDENGQPMVTDFGLARDVTSADGMTRSGVALGTPHYMAPEQVRGDVKHIDARTDVYALGVLLYEMASGRPPFAGGTIAEIYFRILNETPPASGMPRELAVIAGKAMEKEPDRRYPTAAAFADDLKRYLVGEPISARPPSVAYLLKRSMVRHRWVLAAVGAILVAASVGVAAIASSRAAGRKEEQRRKVEPLLEKAREAVEQAERRFLLPGTTVGEIASAFDEAAALAEQAASLDPDSAEALTLLGRVLWRRGGYERAHDVLTRAIAASPKLARPYFYRIRNTLARHAAKPALPAEALPQLRADVDALKRLEHSAGEAVFVEIAISFVEDRDEVVVKAWRERAADLRRAPDAHELLVYVGQSLLATGDGEGAAAVLAEAARAAPGSYLAHYRLGEALTALRRFPEADAAYTAAIQLRPDLWLFRNNRGSARAEAVRLDEAIDDFSHAIRMSGDEAVLAYGNRGRAKLLKGDFAGAEADYRRVMQLDPKDLTAVRKVADIALDLRRPAEAIPFYERLLASGRTADLLARYGVAIAQSGDLAKADELFVEAIGLDERSVDAWFNHGLVYAARRNHEEALKCMTRCLEIDPEYEMARLQRGLSHFMTGRHAEAADDLERYLRKDAANVQARRFLGDASFHLERWARCVELLQPLEGEGALDDEQRNHLRDALKRTKKEE
jgi:serine/threonine-protein kinase